MEKVKKGKKKRELKPIDKGIIGFFDIETSKIIPDGQTEPMQVMYLGNMVIYNFETNVIVTNIFVRTMEEMVSQFKSFGKEYGEIVFYAHNLDYELFHMLRETQASSLKSEKCDCNAYGIEKEISIFRDKNSPLQIQLEEIEGVIFKDSLALFNKTIQQMGKDLVKRHGKEMGKLEYDYSVVRLPWSKLTSEDYEYNHRDNMVVIESLKDYIKDNNLTYREIPLTFTGMTKLSRERFIKKEYGEKGFRNIINEKYFRREDNYKLYSSLLKSYTGGLTTSNYSVYGKGIKNVISVDIKSSYPHQMTKQFPVYEKDKVIEMNNEESNEFFQKYLKDKEDLANVKSNLIKGYVGDFTFTKLKIKNKKYLLPVSTCGNGIINKDVIEINGKIKECGELTITLNDALFQIIKLCYNFEEVYCHNIKMTTVSRYLSEQELSFYLYLFNIKENIDKEKEPVKYALSKIMINACYGVKVQKPVRDCFTLLDGEVTKYDFETVLATLGITQECIYNEIMSENHERKIKKDFDIFSDGCMVTSYARLQLVKFMVTLVDEGFTPIYCDTDSLKFYHETKNIYNTNIHEIINEVNNKIINGNKNHYAFVTFKNKYDISDESFERICRLGIWEIENEIDDKGKIIPYEIFITLGAKKYAYIEKDKKGNLSVHTTIAGCNKKNLPIAIENYAKNENISLVEALEECFMCGIKYDFSITQKYESVREKRSIELMNTFTYEGKPINSYGGIVLRPTEYTLNISKNDDEVLDNVERQDEYICTLNLEGEMTWRK